MAVDNFSSGFANFLTDTPVLFGANYADLLGAVGGIPGIGSYNDITDTLNQLRGNLEEEFFPTDPALATLNRFAGIPLSLLVIDSYMSETHTATSNITNNPVESGPNITSHAFPNPATLEITFVVNDQFFSDFSVGGTNLTSAPFVGAVNRVTLAYLVLDTLRRSSTPVFVTTRSYIYSSMLINSIVVHRDIDYYTRGAFTVGFTQLFQAQASTTGTVEDLRNGIEHEFNSLINRGRCNSLLRQPDSSSPNLEQNPPSKGAKGN